VVFLLDTNVVSATRKVDREPHLASWLAGCRPDDLYFSALTDMELGAGVLRKEKTDPAQGGVLRAWLEATRELYAGRIVPFTAETARYAAGLWLGRSRGYVDTLIAATALAAGLTLVTRNTKDFTGIEGLRLVNPWQQ
jgi:predicted nucleic acid-binding protein